MAALHPLTLDRLERVLQQAGCPVCNEMERTTSRYLRALIREHKSHDGVWERLQRTWGLCRQHTRGMLTEEPRTLPGVRTARLYRWLAEAMLKNAGASRLTPAEFRAAQARGDVPGLRAARRVPACTRAGPGADARVQRSALCA